MRRANSLVATGEIELMSTTVLPGARPSATPPGPNSTVSTSGVSGTMVMITSAFSAAAAGDAHARPPAATRSAGTSRRVLRNSSCPPRIRCPAIGAPMMPSPIKPPFMACPPPNGGCARGAVRRKPPQTRRGRGLRLVLAPNPARVARPVKRREQDGIVDLPRARLVTAGVVGDLDVRDPVLERAERREKLAGHALLVVEIVL